MAVRVDAPAAWLPTPWRFYYRTQISGSSRQVLGPELLCLFYRRRRKYALGTPLPTGLLSALWM